MRALGGRDLGLQPAAFLGGLGEQGARLVDGGQQFRLAVGGFLGFRVQLVRVTSTARRLRLRGQVPFAFCGQPDRAAQPLFQRGEPVPGVLGGGESRRVGGDPLLQLVLLRLTQLHGLLDLGAPGAGRVLVGFFAGDVAALVDQVVGVEAQSRVAQVCLDGLGAPGDLGLLAQRLELAAQFRGEVGQPGQVGLHRVQLAQRLFLALAVLQDACGLFDERAAALWLGLQDRAELPLTDDDVHLAADTRVGQQFLHVHQAAGTAVDLVLAGAVAEHPPRDGHLGVVDRQRAIAVVDGQRHLGATERRAAGGAGEDDVFHLAAAQRLGTLFSHDPGERVEDVGLTGAVRPDDAGDAGFEAQRGSRGEGLEALQRQAFQVHAAWASRDPFERGYLGLLVNSGRSVPTRHPTRAPPHPASLT